MRHTATDWLKPLALAVSVGLAMPAVSADTIYYLRAGVTTVTMPDASVIPMWGFALDSAPDVDDGTVTVPGPRLTVPSGDTLTIYLKNRLASAQTGFGTDAPVSLAIPGQIAPMTPVRWGATPYPEYEGRIRSLTHETAAGNATPVAYTWTNVKPGTYVYHSGTHMQVQVQMGLYGMLTVDSGASEAYPGVAYDEEVLLFYSEIDPGLHAAVSTGNYGPGQLVSSTIDYLPAYFLVNGRPFAVPGGPFPVVRKYNRVLLRFANMGLNNHAPIVDGNYVDIVAEDASPHSFGRQEYNVFLPPMKTLDAILIPKTPGQIAIYDRMLSLSNGDGTLGGMFSYVTVEEDVVTQWNSVTISSLMASGMVSTAAARRLAMVHAAAFDAINAIEQQFQPVHATVTPAAGASSEAAIAAAAHRVLSQVAPDQSVLLDAALAASLARVPDGASENDGVALGQDIGDQILAWRATDHSTDMVPYTPGSDPGDWQPTPPSFMPAMMPHWRYVTPFVLPAASQFRPPAPDMSTPEYAAAFDEVKALGANNSATRTMHQTQTAMFWADMPGTATTVGRWNLIAQQVAGQRDLTLYERARLFALLNTALADAGIAAWDCKYEYSFWRPITAIANADSDGNPATISDAAWESLLMTPAFPEYVSAHSTFSGAAARLLSLFFASDDASFAIASFGQPATTRTYAKFSGAAAEAGMSRIYGGIHFGFSNTLGLDLGRQVGQYVVDNAMQPIP